MLRLSLHGLVLLLSCLYLLSFISTCQNPKNGLIALCLHPCSKLVTMKKSHVYIFFINLLIFFYCPLFIMKNNLTMNFWVSWSSLYRLNSCRTSGLPNWFPLQLTYRCAHSTQPTEKDSHQLQPFCLKIHCFPNMSHVVSLCL